MDISVIIVTYNSAACIGTCLDSIRRQEGVRAEVLVVDNASADSTAAVVRGLGDEIRLITNPENVGFGRACNDGFAASRGRYLYMLNPDAQMEERNGLARLVEAMERNAGWGIAGTRLLRENGELESMGETQYPGQKRGGRDFSHLPGKLAWVSGATLFIRRKAFEDVAGFDPGFFLTSEETDLCLRVRQHGWEIGFVPEVTVRHVGMVSERGVDPYETWYRRFPGIMRFWTKHYPAENARRLIQRDWFRASFRRGWYGLMSRISGPRSEAWRKHRKYAGISEASRDFLRKGSA